MIIGFFKSVYAYGTTPYFISSIIGNISSGNSDIISNKYPHITGLMPISQIPNMADACLAVRAVYGNLILKDTQYATVEELHNAMGDTIVCYKMQTPILLGTVSPLTLKTLRSTNNVWSNANGAIDLAYWSH